ncbi:N-acetylglucosamine-6-phosphate deacetylase [Halioglobus sp. Uisw_031]|uniref:N-acetylglucosamine-6-phosphate deacetylase n=1 Tax=Halioglobus sp. Uisw_031 TaxID=3230977 RepID=UPI0039EB3004
MLQAIVNGCIFDGESVHEHKAVLIEGEHIVAVVDPEQVPADIGASYDLEGGTLIPGFIDLQVNGGGGVLFTAAPTVDSLRTIGAAHRQYGTTGFLPTLITTRFDVMREAVSAVAEAIAIGTPGVLGLHLEGPFLSPERKGVHDAGKFCQLDQTGFDILTSLQVGSTVVTLAPELTSPQMISRLVEEGVIVCGGHSGATYAQTRDALAQGLSGFTHLYNAMTPLQSREPGMVGAALADDDSWFGIIADGHHIHPAAFSVAVAAKKRGGALLVTDAMPTVGSPDTSFILDGNTIVASEGRVTNAEGTLAGSDLTMLSAVNNAAEFARLDWFEAVRMASLYPARALGLERELGAIRPGFRASLLALDSAHRIRASWVNGAMA